MLAMQESEHKKCWFTREGNELQKLWPGISTFLYLKKRSEKRRVANSEMGDFGFFRKIVLASIAIYRRHCT